MGHPKQKWLTLFEAFIKEIRIQSKESSSDFYDPRGVPLELWGSQQIALKSLCEGMDRGIRHFVFLKARQLGISTIFLAMDIFWLAIHPGTIGALVTESETNRNIFRETIERYVASFPPGFFGKSFTIVRANKDFILFSNNSRLDFIVAGTSAKKNWGEGRGYALAHLCVAGGTPVVLEHGRIKAIEDVKIGDRVLTHAGNEATVIDVVGQPNTKGPMIKISPWMGHPVFCTDEHTIPTQRGIVEARDLKKSDWLIMPLRKILDNKPTLILERGDVDRHRQRNEGTVGLGKEIVINEEFGFAIGYYLAEGHLIHGVKNGFATGITFARHRDESAYADRAIAAIRDYTSGHRKTVDRKDCLTSTDTVYGSAFAQWIEDNFGCRDEKFIPDKVFEWGEDFCRGLLSGLLCGDGSKTQGFSQGKYPNNQMILPTTRSSIAIQSRDIAAALGYGWGAVRYKAGGNHYGRICKPCWRVHWYGSSGKSLRKLIGVLVSNGNGHKFSEKYKIEDGLVYLRIKKIEQGFSEPEMWDISVDHDDHTFRTPYFSIGNTEVASYGSAEGLAGFQETLAQANPNRLFIYESTAKGPNHYNDLWIEFGNDEYTKKRTFIGWWSKELNEIHKSDPRWRAYGVAPPGPEEQELIDKVQKEYGFTVTQPKLAWYRWKDADEASDAGTLHQNNPWTAEQAFVLSGHSFFQVRVLQKDRERCKSQIFKAYRYWLGNDFWAGRMENIWQEERLNEVQLRVWEEPDPDGMYVIGVDPAYGRNDNKDRHAITVLRCFADKLIQVAEYADNNVETRQCAWVLAHLAGAYRNCIINVEITGPGGVILTEIEHLREIMKLNAEFDEKTKKNDNWEDFLGNARWYIYNKPDSFGPGHVKCWETSWKTKFQFMNQVRDNYSTGIIRVNSIPLIDEMLKVVQDGSHIGAPGNAKDDRVFALALANRIWIDNLRIGMIARRETYAEMMLQKAEGVDIKGKMVSNIVGNFFKTAEQMALEDQDDTPQWLRDRGFV